MFLLGDGALLLLIAFLLLNDLLWLINSLNFVCFWLCYQLAEECQSYLGTYSYFKKLSDSFDWISLAAAALREHFDLRRLFELHLCRVTLMVVAAELYFLIGIGFREHTIHAEREVVAALAQEARSDDRLHVAHHALLFFVDC